MRIKVTGYLDIDDESLIDAEHKTGLSAEGFEMMSSELELDDLTFEKVD